MLDAKKYVILCPAFKQDGKPCEREWDFKLCKEVGVLTLQEMQTFEEGFELNLFYLQMGGKQCPICDSFVIIGLNQYSDAHEPLY